MRKIIILVLLLTATLAGWGLYKYKIAQTSEQEYQPHLPVMTNTSEEDSRIFPGVCDIYKATKEIKFSSNELSLTQEFLSLSNAERAMLMAYSSNSAVFCVPNDGKEGARIATFDKRSKAINFSSVSYQNFATESYIIFQGWDMSNGMRENLYMYKRGGDSLQLIPNSTLNSPDETYYGFAQLDAHLDIKERSASSVEVSVFQKTYDQSESNKFIRSVTLDL